MYNDTDTFVITGDIQAMWLRDSTNQVLPYMAYVEQDEGLSAMVQNLVRRQTHSVLIDPYANAFQYNGSTPGEHQDDTVVPPMQWAVFEGKYELDSLAAFLKLSYAVYNATGGTASCFDSTWEAAVGVALDTIEAEQAGTLEEGANPTYSFERETTTASDTLAQSGRGASAKRCGLSKCGFRPSDDATTLPFLVPANAMAVVELRHLAEMAAATGRSALAARATDLASSIDDALQLHAVMASGTCAKEGGSGAGDDDTIFAYEVDGFGSSLFMDDANVPSLLSLPYLGYLDASEPLYERTRAAVLSERNPFYFEGIDAQDKTTHFTGVGSPHTGLNYIWPMSLIIRAITSDDDDEIADCLDQLKVSSAGTGFMHESFYHTDPSEYSRSWFAWANSLFGEMVLKVAAERPHLILKQ